MTCQHAFSFLHTHFLKPLSGVQFRALYILQQLNSSSRHTSPAASSHYNLPYVQKEGLRYTPVSCPIHRPPLVRGVWAWFSWLARHVCGRSVICCAVLVCDACVCLCLCVCVCVLLPASSAAAADVLCWARWRQFIQNILSRLSWVELLRGS